MSPSPMCKPQNPGVAWLWEMCGINNHIVTVFGLVSESSVISVLIYFAKSTQRHCSSLLDYKASKNGWTSLVHIKWGPDTETKGY